MSYIEKSTPQMFIPSGTRERDREREPRAIRIQLQLKTIVVIRSWLKRHAYS